MALGLGTLAPESYGRSCGLNETLRAAVTRRKIPAVVAMAANATKTIYSGAFGKRDSASGVDLTAGSIFRIASMTKPITTVAAMQLVESGEIKLDEPVSKWLPALEDLPVLDGFVNDSGAPIFHLNKKPITLRLLLTHTAGFAYDTWDETLLKYAAQAKERAKTTTVLMSDPGTRWEYGTNLDWTGKLVEAVTKQTLEAYFQHNIFEPLEMRDTSFNLPPEKFDRLVGDYHRSGSGSLQANPRKQPSVTKYFNGGGGLYSTAGDYVRFMQMILRGGLSSGGARLLQAKTVETMESNQIGELSAGKMKSFRPTSSSDVDFHPGFTDKFGFGFLINTTGYEGGRSAGSLAWAGIENTFFWIDPRRGVCAALMMQFLPFCDAEAIGLLRDFEKALYATLG